MKSKMKMMFAVAAMSLSGVASAQLPSLNLSAVGDNIPGLGSLGIQNLVLGGPDFFVPPLIVRGGEPSGVPSLTLSLVGGDLPLPGLSELGFNDLVLGGPQGFIFPDLVGGQDLALLGSPLLNALGEGLPDLPLFDGSIPLIDVLPGLDALPVSPAVVLGLLDPSVVGDVLGLVFDPAGAELPRLPGR